MLSGCKLFNLNKMPDIDGWWTLTVHYNDCNCSNAAPCPNTLIQAVGIAFPSTRQFRVEFRVNDNGDLTAVFYEGNNFLFEMNGNLENTGDFTVSYTIGNGTGFFDGSVEGDSRDGRTEMDLSVAKDVTCHGWGLWAGSRI
ncbi:MAG: hypothetical protein MUP70_06750 [Candidatus Aminicenantes bacterium]|nr:hypothetical protein [Candidatus Aminicenantes bacterium]